MNNNRNNSGASIELMGHIKLTDLQYAQVTQANGLNYLMIPIEYNPCLYLGTNKQDGKPYVSMDITTWRSNNLKNENTHFIRASVISQKAKTMTNDQKKAASPIIGNLKPAKSAQEGTQQGAGQGYMAPGAIIPPAGQQGIMPPPISGQQFQGAPQQGAPAPAFAGSGYNGGQGPYPQQAAPQPQAPQQRPPYPPMAQGGAYAPGAGYVPGDIPPGIPD